MLVNIPDEFVDKIVYSLRNESNKWTMDNDLLIHERGIYIGNYSMPSCLIVHVDGMKFGVTKSTITADQANKISETAVEIAKISYEHRLRGVINSF